MDVTIIRVEADRFHITSGAATRARDLTHLRRNLPDSVQIDDVTEDLCTVGVMGAGSRRLLAGLGDLPEVPFGHATQAHIAQETCRATRVSFVGELGWELTVANAGALALFDALNGAGARPMGYYALDGCRLEKGYKHWGHDLGPMVTPLEAGLMFTMDWTKECIGKSALDAQRHEGFRQRLVLMQVEGDALVLHDEPVHEAGRPIGLTTSGARGPRTGLNLCFAMIEVALRETLGETCSRSFTLRVAGQDYPAAVLRRPPFDPKGERMRA